jgi:hypothetical protein
MRLKDYRMEEYLCTVNNLKPVRQHFWYADHGDCYSWTCCRSRNRYHSTQYLKKYKTAQECIDELTILNDEYNKLKNKLTDLYVDKKITEQEYNNLYSSRNFNVCSKIISGLQSYHPTTFVNYTDKDMFEFSNNLEQFKHVLNNDIQKILDKKNQDSIITEDTKGTTTNFAVEEVTTDYTSAQECLQDLYVFYYEYNKIKNEIDDLYKNNKITTNDHTVLSELHSEYHNNNYDKMIDEQKNNLSIILYSKKDLHCEFEKSKNGIYKDIDISINSYKNPKLYILEYLYKYREIYKTLCETLKNHTKCSPEQYNEIIKKYPIEYIDKKIEEKINANDCTLNKEEVETISTLIQELEDIVENL